MENVYSDKTMGEVIDKTYDAGFKAAVDKACEWFRMMVDIPQDVAVNENGEPLAESYINYATKRAEAANEIIEEFKKYMNS